MDMLFVVCEELYRGGREGLVAVWTPLTSGHRADLDQ